MIKVSGKKNKETRAQMMAAKVGNNELVEEVEDRHYWILRVYVLFFDGEYLYA